MCGICGIWYFDPERSVEDSVLHEMTNRLEHRGPDEAGYYVEGSLGLGARRLRIIDVAGSKQPVPNEGKSAWLVCNGEIYNFRQLRSQLSNRHHFCSQGDIEAILHLYEDHGAGCVHHLRGMFAFALWDTQARKLTLAVDRFGKKPLYYLLDREKLVFASELKALLRMPDIQCSLDYQSLDEYLSCGYISAPRTIFTQIRKVCPGETIVIQDNAAAQHTIYWQPVFSEESQWDKRPLRDIAANLRVLVEEAVQFRLQSDVPVGAFLSGGVDSTVVVSMMRQFSSTPVKTFSIGFDEPAYDESRYAQACAAYFHTEHFVEVIRSDALELLPQMVQHYDEPFADSSMIPTYLVSKLARQHVTVALSGDGGDEVFAGYHQHLYAYRQHYLRSIIPATLYTRAVEWSRLLPQFSKVRPYLTQQPACNWLSNGFFSALQRHQLYSTETRNALAGYESEQVKQDIFRRVTHLDGVSQLQYHDLTAYLPGDILVKVDRASMLSSLEVRSPLLDHPLFEFMAQVPVHHRLDLRSGKTLLKQALGDLLPPFVHRRKKQGFSIPQSEWLHGEWMSLLVTGFDNSALFNHEVIHQMISEHGNGSVDHKDRLWALLCLRLWMRDQKFEFAL